MNVKEATIDIELRAKAVKLSVSTICRAIGVNRSTWQRWKGGRGNGPRMTHAATIDALIAAATPQNKGE